MYGGTQESSYLEVARAVLGALCEQFGLGCIQRLDSETLASLGERFQELGSSIYVLAAHSLQLSTSELLVMLDRPLEEHDDERLLVLTKVARKLDNCRMVTCVADGIRQDADLKIDGLTVRFCESRRLFSSILRLPPSFDAQLETLAGIQRPDEFKYAYQERKARVHVVAGRQPAKQWVDLSQYFKDWLGKRRRHSPILLLGERGSGKSWQMLRFALDAHRLHNEQPWRYGPAFLVRLRDLVDLVEHATSTSPVICEYLFQNHPGLSALFGGTATLAAMFGTGHAVVLVDGFDEMDVLPTDARVRNRLMSLLLLLSKKTRFVLSSRSGHFSSLSSLFAMPAWSESTIAQLFEVLTITPFDEKQKVAYINAARSQDASSIQRIFAFGDKTASPLQHALSICASHPGLLAQIKDDVDGGVDNPLKLIGDAIFAILIDFNLLHGRTQEDYRVVNSDLAVAYGLPPEKWIELSQARRADLLSDIAWYMAERGVDTVDLTNLSPRIRLEYGIADEALERDLRSQTVFELATNSHSASHSDVDTSGDSRQIPYRRTEKSHVAGSSMVRFSIRDPAADSERVGESSVTGAYFLARQLATRLLEPGPFGNLPAAIRFRYLGRGPLGAMGAAMLGEMLRSAGYSERHFGEEAWRLLIELAKDNTYQVFSPSYRYLVSNLQLLGGLSQEQAKMLDPWQSSVSKIVKGSTRQEMEGYKMALIPPSPSTNTEQESRPFLLGVHEITNEHFHRFVTSVSQVNGEDCTVEGSEWSVERVTIAGSGDARSRSDNHRLTNEYHLFTWLPTERSASTVSGARRISYLPPRAVREHPVTYVSWFAAAAFCDWLSIGEGIDRAYRGELLRALEGDGTVLVSEKPKLCAVGYRLPSLSEWMWAAKGGHESLQRPWEAFPYYLKELSAQDRKHKPSSVVDDDAWKRYLRYQQVMRAVLLGTGKQAREVLYDEPNDFGVSGLMGNVREWCQDSGNSEERESDQERESERLILGSTGFLGEGTFNFKYKTSLYQRNTNPDVGFRVARSLRPDDVKQLRRREMEIASLETEL